MDPGIVILLMTCILGGCGIAITSMIIGAKKNSLTDDQMQQLMTKIEAWNADNQELKKQVEDLYLIASDDYHELPPAK